MEFGKKKLTTKVEDLVNQLVYPKNTYEYAEREYNYISPTDLDTCCLALYFKMKKVPGTGEIKYQTQRYFNRGIDSETRFMADIEATGKLVAQQVVLVTDEPLPPTRGKIDGIIEEDGVLKIVVHTTKTNAALKKLKEAPANKYRQWNWYAGMTGLHEGYCTVDGGAESPIAWFPVTFDQELFDKCLAKFTYIYNCVKNNTPPEPDADHFFGSQHCLDCMWFDHHWGNNG